MEQANRRCKYVEFEVGDLVLVHLHKDRFPPGKFGKIKPRVDGPFKIIEKIGENAYKLQLPNEYKISPMFNVKDLKASLFVTPQNPGVPLTTVNLRKTVCLIS